MTATMTPPDHRDLVALVAAGLLRLPYTPWHFGDSVGFEAMLAASDHLGDPTHASFAHGYMRSWAARRHPFGELDCTAPGLAMVQVAERTGDGLLTEALVELAAFLRSRPTHLGVYQTWERSPLRQPYGPVALRPAEVALLAEPPPGVFLDCLHFDPPFFSSLGRYLGDDHLVDEGVRQALGYCAALQGDDGLFDHFVLADLPGSFGPGWGRGQGWALLGLLDVLEHIDSDHPSRSTLVDHATRLIGAMIRTQRADGHWDAVVGEPASSDESSTAAFMGAGFLRAVELGVVDDISTGPIDAGTVVDAAERAVAAVEASISPAGTLEDVSAAVWACTEPTHYHHVPRGFIVPWGEGPAVLALIAHDRHRARVASRTAG